MWKGLLRNPEGTLVEHLKYPGIVEKLTIEVDGQEPVDLSVGKGITTDTAIRLAKYMVSGRYNRMTYIIAGTTSSFLSGDDESD